MDNQRIILWGLFASLAFITFSQWQIQNRPQSEVATPPAATPAAPGVPAPVVDAMPDAPLPPVDSVAAAPAELPQPALRPELPNIKVHTDVLRVEISRKGGTLVRAELLAYPVDKKNPDNPVVLLSEDPANRYVLQSGLVDSNRSGPTHDAVLQASADRFELTDGADTLTVPLTWRSPEGVEVTKTYTFTRGHYDIGLNYTVSNRSDADWPALSYLRISRVHNPPDRSMFDVDSYSFVGPVYYDTEKYEKVDP